MTWKWLNWLSAVQLPEPQLARNVVQLTAVHKIYVTGAGEFEALKGVDLSVSAGEFVALVGKSGSGKSTLINMITLTYSDVARRFTNLFEEPEIVLVNDKYYEAGLIHRTLRGELVRSKSEVSLSIIDGEVWVYV